MFKKLYHWTLALAESPRATFALGAVSFAESSFFPIPPDVILVPMALAKPQRALFYALVCTLTSVAGGIVGYGIGWLLWDTLGQWLINLYGYGARMEVVKAAYDQWGWLFILVKGLTPIPSSPLLHTELTAARRVFPLLSHPPAPPRPAQCRKQQQTAHLCSHAGGCHQACLSTQRAAPAQPQPSSTAEWSWAPLRWRAQAQSTRPQRRHWSPQPRV